MAKWVLTCKYTDALTGRTVTKYVSLKYLALGDDKIVGRPKLLALLWPAINAVLGHNTRESVRVRVFLIRKYWEFLDYLATYTRELGMADELLDISNWKDIEATWRQWVEWLRERDIEEAEKSRTLWFVKKLVETGFMLDSNGHSKNGVVLELFAPFRAKKSLKLIDTLDVEDARKVTGILAEKWAHIRARLSQYNQLADAGQAFRNIDPNRRAQYNYWSELNNALWFIKKYFPWSGAIKTNCPIKYPIPCMDGIDAPKWTPILQLKKKYWRRRAFVAAIFPTKEDLSVAVALVAAKTPLNPSVIGSLRASEWCIDDPQFPKKRAVIFARKSRAGGVYQRAYSRKAPNTDPYQIIKTVIELTEPLRNIARFRARELRRKKRRTRKEDITLQQLDRLSDAVWIYTTSQHQAIRDLGEGLGNREGNYVNSVVAKLLKGMTTKTGKRLTFKLKDGRHIWALYVYQKSGHNLFLTQFALGHRGLGTILRYLNDRSLRIRNFLRLAKLQSRVLSDLHVARFDARSLRDLVSDGTLDKQTAERLRVAQKSIFGLHCFDPKNPTKGADPGHAEGQLCAAQLCMQCTKWYATIESLPFLQRAILDLKEIEAVSGVLQWESSSYPLWRALFEEVVKHFHPDYQFDAMVTAKTIPPIISTSRFSGIGAVA